MTTLRVLICEDSATYATALRRTLEHDRDITVVAVCSTAEEAISALPRAAPDLVTMDVALPGMDGIDAVGKIMGSRPTADPRAVRPVGPGTGLPAAALAAGALDVLAKDDLDLLRPGRPVGGRTPAPDKGAQPRTRDPPSERPARRPAPPGQFRAAGPP